MWLQLSIQTTEQYAEDLSQLLSVLGAVSVTYRDAADQPLLEPDPGATPLWQKLWVVGLFEKHSSQHKNHGEHLLDFLRQQLDKPAIETYQIETIEDQNWERAWLADFKPLYFGNDLWICPSVMDPPNPQAVNIFLDPGLAFGTGTHPTTALCLEWLAANPPVNQLVVDYGCGSGILAIAALKLGAAKVFAVDHDEQALEATLENAKRNQISLDKLNICYPENLPALQVDLILANILAKPLIELAANFADMLKPKGKIVLSGVTVNQQAEILQAYQEYFNSPVVNQKDDWISVTFKKI